MLLAGAGTGCKETSQWAECSAIETCAPLQELLKTHPTHASQQLRAGLTSADPDEQFWSATGLQKTAEAKDIEALRSALTQGTPPVKAAIIFTLGERQATDARLDLERMLTDSNEDIRAATLVALGKINSPESGEAVFRIPPDTDPELRALQTVLLGLLGYQPSASRALEQLIDPSPLVRSAALEALVDLGSPVPFEVLKAVLQDKDWRVRYGGVYALLELHPKHPELRSILSKYKASESHPEIQSALQSIGL